MGGLFIAAVGVWVIVQATAGNALQRLGLLDPDTTTGTSPDNGGGGGNGGGGSW